MEYIKLSATPRHAVGKGPSRRLRSSGMTPAVIYGKSIETRKISLKPLELQKALSGPLRINTPLHISITEPENGQQEAVLVLVKDHQYDPVTRKLEHVDFLSITEDQLVSVKVPVIKHGRSQGEQLGGILRMIRRMVPIRCKAKDIPEAIHIDVSAMGNGTTLHVSELDLPEGLVITLPPNKVMLTISAIAEEKTDTAESSEKSK